jgi:hypothetical protein
LWIDRRRRSLPRPVRSNSMPSRLHAMVCRRLALSEHEGVAAAHRIDDRQQAPQDQVHQPTSTRPSNSTERRPSGR